MSQIQTLLQILYQHEKGCFCQIERQFAGVEMESSVKAVYERKRANVAELEKQKAPASFERSRLSGRFCFNRQTAS